MRNTRLLSELFGVVSFSQLFLSQSKKGFFNILYYDKRRNHQYAFNNAWND